MNEPTTCGEAVRSSDLLPCPFCGQPPRLKAGKVKCVNKECKVQPKIAAWYVKGYEQNAVDDWNERRQANSSDTSWSNCRVIYNKK